MTTTCSVCGGKFTNLVRMCRDSEGTWYCTGCRFAVLQTTVNGLRAALASARDASGVPAPPGLSDDAVACWSDAACALYGRVAAEVGRGGAAVQVRLLAEALAEAARAGAARAAAAAEQAGAARMRAAAARLVDASGHHAFAQCVRELPLTVMSPPEGDVV